MIAVEEGFATAVQDGHRSTCYLVPDNRTIEILGRGRRYEGWFKDDRLWLCPCEEHGGVKVVLWRGQWVLSGVLAHFSMREKARPGEQFRVVMPEEECFSGDFYVERVCG